ncbi:hypothetical protein K449DRAFT_384761 [Hypoxylon sp. EC38]|nr:hypothetical protein K449DRAFT_384761 [Hypoxylon sp. EC38]
MSQSSTLMKRTKPEDSSGRVNISNPPPDISVNHDHLQTILQQHLSDVGESIRSIFKAEMKESIRSIVEAEVKDVISTLIAAQQSKDSEHESTDSNENYAANHERNNYLQTIQGQTEQITSLHEQLDKMKSESAQEKQKLGKLRAMLIKEAPDHILDNVAIQKFASLRSLIFKFVKSTFNTQSPIAKSQISMDRQQHAIFSPFRDEVWRKKYSVNRLCGLVFSILWELIFSRRLFGPGGSQELDDLHSSLEYVEFLLHNNIPKENLKEFIDWRSASIKCGSFFGANPTIACRAMDTIWSFLQPVAIKPGAEDKGKKLLAKLCKDALELNTDLRRSRDIFEVRTGFRGPLEGHTAYADELASEELGEHTKQAGQPGDIAYCVFGALVKRTEEKPTEDIVLEKASVVVYRGTN